MKKCFLLLLMFLSVLLVRANMASPMRPGSATGFPYLSEYVRVVHENLKITPAKDFKTCQFEVVYDIFADTSGLSIPMLFVAEGYEDGMKIWVDGIAVPLQKVPRDYFYEDRSPLTRFTEIVNEQRQDIRVVRIQWDKNESRSYDMTELHFFEFDLAAGPHQIRVEYTSKVWRYLGDRIAEEKFLYALEPAKQWQSFGALDIQLDLRQSPYPVRTNLPTKGEGDSTNILTWHFEGLPDVPTLEIKAIPTISAYATTLINFGDEGFFWSSWILLAILHVVALWFWRRKHFQKWFSWVWLVGSIVAPIIVLMITLASDNWIDNAIGPIASRRPSYDGLIVIFYPVFLIIHGIVLQIVDILLRMYRRKKKP